MKIDEQIAELTEFLERPERNATWSRLQPQKTRSCTSWRSSSPPSRRLTDDRAHGVPASEDAAGPVLRDLKPKLPRKRHRKEARPMHDPEAPEAPDPRNTGEAGEIDSK